ncbi:hypothetical protein HYV89_05445 [Candidatus Woesearchaeota archaeon]|nr:hypothetical protein [Candidatus Woesearchaeota archaeon]
MNKGLFLLIIVFLISIYSAFAVIDILSFEASLFDSTGDPINGNITVEIYDAASGGNLICNSSNGSKGNIIRTKEFNHG